MRILIVLRLLKYNIQRKNVRNLQHMFPFPRSSNYYLLYVLVYMYVRVDYRSVSSFIRSVTLKTPIASRLAMNPIFAAHL